MKKRVAHSKRIIELLKKNGLGAGISNIWDNTYGCDEHYRCATDLHLISILKKSYNKIIEHGISAP